MFPFIPRIEARRRADCLFGRYQSEALSLVRFKAPCLENSGRAFFAFALTTNPPSREATARQVDTNKHESSAVAAGVFSLAYRAPCMLAIASRDY
jgi:hypothetical protein